LGTIAGDYQDTQMGKRATLSKDKYISSGGGRRTVHPSTNSKETIQYSGSVGSILQATKELK
jgi:hypothetical protein